MAHANKCVLCATQEKLDMLGAHQFLHALLHLVSTPNPAAGGSAKTGMHLLHAPVPTPSHATCKLHRPHPAASSMTGGHACSKDVGRGAEYCMTLTIAFILHACRWMGRACFDRWPATGGAAVEPAAGARRPQQRPGPGRGAGRTAARRSACASFKPLMPLGLTAAESMRPACGMSPLLVCLEVHIDGDPQEDWW